MESISYYWFYFIAFVFGLIVAVGFVPLAAVIGSMLQFWKIIPERTAFVYTLFGKVMGTLDEPGVNFPMTVFGPKVLLVTFFGKIYKVETCIWQRYLRDQMVNSEEGAPMGVGVWYEYFVTNPEDYLFRNSDPVRSLAANVSTAVVKQLSNLKLDTLLEDRDALSQKVREEVSPTSEKWGFGMGSTYIRKVAFRDKGMILEIEKKVVNRLRQVTAGMRQQGDNQVQIISSEADRQAAVKLGQAAAVRPRVVGEALGRIRQNPEVAEAMFDLLDLQATLRNKEGKVILAPDGGDSPRLMLSC